MTPSAPLADSRRGTSLRFGLNYVPSRLWYHCWNDWDAASIRSDMRAMAGLGIDHLRVQLIWPYFQPNPTYVSKAHLDRLSELMTLAADAGMDVLLTPLTGFLSGYFYLPAGITPQAVFRAPEAIAQERDLFSAVIDRVGRAPNLMGFDLGNEINCLDHMPADGLHDRWALELVAFIKKLLPETWVVNGVDHNPWLAGTTFSLDHLASAYDAVSLHCWPMFSGALRKGALDDPPSLELLGFMTQLARLYQGQAAVPGSSPASPASVSASGSGAFSAGLAANSPAAAAPVWIQEFGATDQWGTAAQKETFLRHGMRRACEEGASLFTWWCSHELDRSFRFDPLEYDLGLLTQGNEPKPLFGVFREVMEDLRRSMSQAASGASSRSPLQVPRGFRPGPLRPLPAEMHWLDKTLASSVWPLYETYLAEKAAGRDPVLVWGD